MPEMATGSYCRMGVCTCENKRQGPKREGACDKARAPCSETTTREAVPQMMGSVESLEHDTAGYGPHGREWYLEVELNGFPSTATVK